MQIKLKKMVGYTVENKNINVKHVVIVTESPKNKIITPEEKKLIDRLWLEKIPLAGIVRSVGISRNWLQKYVNEKYETYLYSLQLSQNAF